MGTAAPACATPPDLSAPGRQDLSTSAGPLHTLSFCVCPWKEGADTVTGLHVATGLGTSPPCLGLVNPTLSKAVRLQGWEREFRLLSHFIWALCHQAFPWRKEGPCEEPAGRVHSRDGVSVSVQVWGTEPRLAQPGSWCRHCAKSGLEANPPLHPP